MFEYSNERILQGPELELTIDWFVLQRELIIIPIDFAMCHAQIS